MSSSDSCEILSDENCFCYETSGNPTFWGFISITVALYISYACWTLFVILLQCRDNHECVICQIHDYNNNNNNNNNNECGICQIQSGENQKIWLHFLFYVISICGWIFGVPVIAYLIDPPQYDFMRWRWFYAFKSLFSLTISSLIFILETNKQGKTQWKEVVILWGLMLPGFAQIIFNLPNTSKSIDTTKHAQRIISTEYTIFICLCLSFSICLLIFLKLNRGRFDDSTKNNKFILCLKMLSFTWAANLLKDYINLIADYEKKEFYFVWEDLTWKENKHLAFNGIQICLSLMLSLFCQFETYHAHWAHVAFSYITLNNIVYFFRVTIIYNEFTWLFCDITEVIIGHTSIFIGIWYLFYVTDEKDGVQSISGSRHMALQNDEAKL